jgi:hypothetical protein
MVRLTNRIHKAIRALAGASLVLLVSAAVPEPAAAQFWNQLFGGQRQPPPRMVPQRQYQQPYNPFSTFFGVRPDPRYQQQQPQQAPRDYSQAPAPQRRSAESQAAITSPILVLGDAMADWLAYGLEDAFSEKPEFGIVRKHRSYSGLIRYDPRRDIEWPQVAREAIAAEKPKFIVMMVGYHDRQAIRDRTPTTPTPGRGATQHASNDPYLDPDSPESRARASADAQNAEMRKAQGGGSSSGQQKSAAPPSGPLEFQSEAWQAVYIQRIDATIAALKTANVPVFWVGLPPQRVARLSTDASYLNDLYRARAERAGIIFVDIWDGFVDEAGRYVVQGPDLEGQTRRLRSGDGVYFTASGARKLAHYVEREILRNLLATPTPVALPLPEPAVPGRPGASRPLAGPVIPLTATLGGGNELLGGGPTRPTRTDPVATRVLVRGEPVTAPAGRADNFAWPRGGEAIVKEAEPEAEETPEEAAPQATVQPPAQAPAGTPPRPPLRTSSQTPSGAQQKAAPQANPNVASRPKTQPSADAKQPVQQRKAPPRRDNVPRPPLPLLPFFR